MANYKDITSLNPDGTLSVEWTAEQILRQTDWTQLPDCGLTQDCKKKFIVYREAIRVFRRTKPVEPVWPQCPVEEFV